MNLEEVNIDLLDLKDLNESIESIDNGDLVQIKNVIYSEPFLYDDNLEYLFKLHIMDDTISLHELIIDDNKDTITKSIIKETFICSLLKKKGLDLINQYIDIRDKTSILNNDIVNLEYNLDNIHLNENKKAVLTQMYTLVLESYN